MAVDVTAQLEVQIQVARDDFLLDVAFAGTMPGVTALFGVSGAGKTSVLQALAGLLRPQAGRAQIGDDVLFDMAARHWPAPEERGVGVVFQDARLFPHISVVGNLRYGLNRRRQRPLVTSLDEIIELLGLDQLLDRRPGSLSGGERQRVAVGRALLAQPRLLLMDEPLAALDAPRRAEVLPYLAQLRDRLAVPIVYVSHAWEEVLQLADTLVVMDAGRVVAQGPVTDVAARLDVPLVADRVDAGVAINATVLAHDTDNGLTTLAFDGGTLLISAIDAPLAQGRRIRVAARDVLLASRRPEGLSAHNILAGEVGAIDMDSRHQALVRVMVGPTPVLARVTSDTVRRLALAPGAAVFVILKSVAVDR